MVWRWMYDAMYRRGAPWEIGARDELVDLVTSGQLSADRLPTAVDLGCGSGANSVFLAQHGFTVTGIDFSKVALAKARAAAEQAGVAARCHFLEGDLTANPVRDTFDLVIDYGTLDDLKGPSRDAMTSLVHQLTEPGSSFLLWCFYGDPADLPWFSFRGPSRVAAGLAPGEVERRFGDAFEIERLAKPIPETHTACFLLTRR